MTKRLRSSGNQLALPLGSASETPQEQVERDKRAAQVLRNQQEYAQRQRESEALQRRFRQELHKAQLQLVADSLATAKAIDSWVESALLRYVEDREARNARIDKKWMFKSAHPDCDERDRLFVQTEDGSVLFQDQYWELTAQIANYSTAEVHVQDEQGFVIGSETEINERWAMFTLTSIWILSECCMTIDPVQSHAKLRVVTMHCSDRGAAETALLNALERTGIEVICEIRSD